MTWSCPYCGRDYPDSILGVPKNATADEKEGCEICWVSPVGTAEYVSPGSLTMTESTPNHWKCPGCGDEVHVEEHCEPWECLHCGTEMQPASSVGEPLVDRLEELVEEWRNLASKTPHPMAAERQAGYHADELEAVIEDYV